MMVTRMVLSLAQMPALSSGGSDPQGDTACRVGLVPRDHIPLHLHCIPTGPPTHQLYLLKNACALAEAIWRDSLYHGHPNL